MRRAAKGPAAASGLARTLAVMQARYAYAEARAALVDALARDAVLHEQGRFEELGKSFEELDARVPRGAGAAFDYLLVALRFMDDWLDAKEHEWQYHEPLQRDDWPVLARTLAQDLVADRAPTNPLVRKHFLDTKA
jgi:hypothetical protein